MLGFISAALKDIHFRRSLICTNKALGYLGFIASAYENETRFEAADSDVHTCLLIRGIDYSSKSFKV
jgi:hypothetical protein